MTSKAVKSTKDLGSITLSPVELLDTNAARTFTHFAPVLTLGLFYVYFSSIVADPTTYLTALLLPVCLVQNAYNVICLPTTTTERGLINEQSSNNNNASAIKGSTHLSRKKTGIAAKHAGSGNVSYARAVIPSLISTLLALSVGAPILTVILVLHGAPLTTHQLHTFLAATHMSVLATIPIFYVHGVSSTRWRELVSLSAPIDEVTGAALGALVGAWVGAVPIPLDWDRDWQRWPVTIVAGMYAGWAFGKLLGAYVFRGKYIRVDDVEYEATSTDAKVN